MDYQKEHIKKSHEYWKLQLTGLPPLLELPVRQSRQSVMSNERDYISFQVSKFCSEALKRLSRQHGTTLFITLLAAFKTLLQRYTSQSDIIIGYPVKHYIVNENGEMKEGFPDAVMPLRTDLSGNPSFCELLARVREVVLDAHTYKDVPSEILLNILKPEISVGAAVLPQVTFMCCENADVAPECNDLPVMNGKKDRKSDWTDLAIFLEDHPEGLTGVLEFNKHLYDSATIDRMSEHFCILLEGIIDNPEQQISYLPILTSEERKKIIFDWNNTAAEYPDSKCIHELFEQQVKLTPHRIAVTLYEVGRQDNAVKEALTYDELNKRANQLAHYLGSQGVKPEVLVGIFVQRSLEMVIAILGVLKAGGAYLPLDQAYPKDRLSFMLEDSQISVLLTQTLLVKELPPHKAKLVCLDNDWVTIAKFEDNNVSSGVTAENLAYVIYTSGSTGRPKGTLIVHTGVVNYLSWCVKAYAMADGDGAPVNSSIAFDATVTSFFSPLLTGKTVMLLPEKGEIEALSEVLLAKKHFSLVKITPAHLQILSQLLPSSQLKGQTNALVIGGEALRGRSLELWMNHAPGTRLINEYGPTETVVGCCVYEASDKDLLTEDIPIGRPIANTQMYILDAHLQPVPIGVAGEIYIGGAGLARGYLNRPDLTAERFIYHVFKGHSNTRLYKTGDLARYLADGTIVFMGRKDHQVKVRGYRIELGEIESTLTLHPQLHQAVVTVREDTPGDKRLVTYLVSKTGNTLTSGDVRKFLKEKLPEYMVPAVFIFLKAFPLTSNGKLDRSSLPAPDQQRHEMEGAFVAPRNALELQLTKIFEDCLKIYPIGIQDNFFDLGANSLQAGYIFSRIKKILGKQIHLTALLQSPTIEQLARYVSTRESAESWSSLVPIQPNGSKPPLFCIHGGVGTVLFYRDLSNSLGPDQPFYGLQAKGLNGIGTPHSNVEEMAALYLTEIRKVQPEEPYYLGGYCFGGLIAFEMAKQLTEQGQKVALLANFNAVSPTYVHPVDPVFEMDETGSEGLSRITRLRKKLNQLDTRGKAVYLLGSLKTKLDNLKNGLYYKSRYKSQMLIYKLCRKFGRPLPEALARFYLYETNTAMVSSYQPEPYEGSMVIFRSPGIYKDPHLGWTKLVKGTIETIDIPGDHQNRRQIMNEPFVEILAKELENYIGIERSGRNAALLTKPLDI